MTSYEFREYIFDRCCHDGEIKLSKKQLDVVFPGNSLEKIEALQPFLAEKGLSFRIDKKRQVFKFVLEESESRAGNIISN